MDWTIDTQVLVDAENNVNGHEHCANTSRFLLEGFINGVRIAFDHERKIQGEYERNLNKTSIISTFLSRFINTGKVHFFSGKVPNRLTSKLDLLAFDPDDRVFVGVALNTMDKYLLAEESDYDEEVISALRAYSITVIDCVDAAVVCST